MPPQEYQYHSGDSQYGSPMVASWECDGGTVSIKVWPTSATETARSVMDRYLAAIDLALDEHPYVK